MPEFEVMEKIPLPDFEKTQFLKRRRTGEAFVVPIDSRLELISTGRAERAVQGEAIAKPRGNETVVPVTHSGEDFDRPEKPSFVRWLKREFTLKNILVRVGLYTAEAAYRIFIDGKLGAFLTAWAIATFGLSLLGAGIVIAILTPILMAATWAFIKIQNHFKVDTYFVETAKEQLEKNESRFRKAVRYVVTLIGGSIMWGGDPFVVVTSLQPGARRYKDLSIKDWITMFLSSAISNSVWVAGWTVTLASIAGLIGLPVLFAAVALVMTSALFAEDFKNWRNKRRERKTKKLQMAN